MFRTATILRLIGAVCLLHGCVVDRTGLRGPDDGPRTGCDAGDRCVPLGPCGSPPDAPDDASLVDVTGQTPGDTALYECDEGYGDDLDEIECQPDGSWEEVDLECEAVDCGKLEDPEDGDVDTDDGTELGAVAEYECDSDYLLLGDDERTCQADGTWSGEPPVCVKEDPCDDDPCKNEGRCSSPEPGVFECECRWSGWTGSTCEDDIDECASGFGPCNPYGTDKCINKPGSFRCDCDSDHNGRLCYKPD